MDLALFSFDGVLFVLRWLHFFFGVTWIGHLYYFNFVQGAFFAETDASTKSNAIQKLVPRALWWFRWGAMGTLITGLFILMGRGHHDGFGIFATSWGVTILLGFAMGLIMWFNVWFVIWPAQKVLIASTTAAAQGKPADPTAAARAARGGVCSRTNTMLSIPLLFFMGAASHLPLSVREGTNFTLIAIVMLLILAAIELNALKGKMGPMTTIKGVIHCGFGLTLVLYFLLEALLRV
jgi:uncharacterized membrane protein